MFTARLAYRSAFRNATTLTVRHQPTAQRPAHLSNFSAAWKRPHPVRHTPSFIPPSRAYTRQSYRRFGSTAGIFRRWAARPTFYYEVSFLGLTCGIFYIANIDEVPVSGRRRFNVVSDAFLASLSATTYQDTLREFGGKILPPTSREHRQVRRVLERLVPHSGLAGEAWEVHVVDEAAANAFVVPGGKVFVFRGILELCGSDDALAAVLGHEISHNVARHAAERMSQMVVLLPVGLVAWVLTSLDPSIVHMLTNLAFTLPGSRKQEEEADYIGLLMMSEACFNPSAAVELWAKMEKAERGSAPPQFLSTHPSSGNRMEKIRGWLAEAEAKRDEMGCGELGGYADEFRKKLRMNEWSTTESVWH